MEQVLQAARAERDAWFYRTHAGAELDLLIVRGAKRFGFEFKFEDAPAPTRSMRVAIEETNRRRAKQEAYNREHGIEPKSIVKAVRDLTDRVGRGVVGVEGTQAQRMDASPLTITSLIEELDAEMRRAAADLQFERAAVLRDKIAELRDTLRLMDDRPEWERLRDERD
jgi:excinuclease ABC subunit B